MATTNIKKTDKQGYDKLYKGRSSRLSFINNPQDYVYHFEQIRLSPFYQGGHEKGFVRGLTIHELIKAADIKKTEHRKVTILDAGSGVGELSVYLACKGFDVIGVDISSEGCIIAEQLSKKIGVFKNCTFLCESLENLPVADLSVDFIIGHAALHHFIKYDGIPGEFLRIMRDNSEGFFADSFGENKLYHIFHDKEKMERLGDVTLTRNLIMKYFRGFEVSLVPTDWFVMLDKVYTKIFPKQFKQVLRKISYIHFLLDRQIPYSSGIALFLAGSVMTKIKKKPLSP